MTKDEMDAEANHFAMCLLVPTEFLKRDLAERSTMDLTDDDGLKSLTRKYGVSMGVMAIRIHQVTNGRVL